MLGTGVGVGALVPTHSPVSSGPEHVSPTRQTSMKSVFVQMCTQLVPVDRIGRLSSLLPMRIEISNSHFKGDSHFKNLPHASPSFSIKVMGRFTMGASVESGLLQINLKTKSVTVRTHLKDGSHSEMVLHSSPSFPVKVTCCWSSWAYPD